jgi:hypothetical protein
MYCMVAVVVDKDKIARMIPAALVLGNKVVLLEFFTIGKMIFTHRADIVLLLGDFLREGVEPDFDFSNFSLIPILF